MAQTLWIDASAGISGDRFAAALIGLGAPEHGLISAIKSAGEGLGMLDAHTHIEFIPDEALAHRLHLTPLEKRDPLPLEDAPAALERALAQAGVTDSYADLAQQALTILRAAESHVNSAAPSAPAKTVPLPVPPARHRHSAHALPAQSALPTPAREYP